MAIIVGAKPWLRWSTVALLAVVFLGLTVGRGCVAWMGAPRPVVVVPPEECRSTVTTMWLRIGQAVTCPPGAAVTIEPGDNEHRIVVCTCPSRPRP